MFAGSNWQQWVALAALAVALAVIVIVGVYLLLGQFSARSLVRRELMAYFVSPIAYVVLVCFLALTGYLFGKTLDLLTEQSYKGTEYPMQEMYGGSLFWMGVAVLLAVLTMRLFAEERGSGTLEMLVTAPLRDWQVVTSKYLACFLFYLLLLLPTLAYLPIVLDLGTPVWHLVITLWSICLLTGLVLMVLAVLLFVPRLGTGGRIVALGLLGAGVIATVGGGWLHYHYDAVHLLTIPARIDPMPVLSSYLGLLLAGAMFLAMGMFVSSLVRNQLLAALISVAVNFLFLAPNIVQPKLEGGSMASFVSVPQHFSQDFCRGLVDSRHVVLYLSVALFSLFLTVRSLESRRWR